MKIKSILGAIVLGAALVSGPAMAQTYVCDIKPTARGKQNAAVNSQFRFAFSGSDVSVSDGFIRATGKRSVRGRFDRQVGNDLLFSWSVGGVPRNLMPQEVTWYRPTIDYRGRLDTKSRNIRIIGNFVARYGGGNTGTNIRGFGNCRRG
jgi:hypothetical protein